MSSFKDGLRRSGQSVLDARAQNLYEMTKIEEERFIQECKMKVLRIKNELNKHRDLSVKSTTSLEVGNGFDPKAWVAKRHQLERDLRVANIEYALALKVDGEEFPADETEEQINVAAVQRMQVKQIASLNDILEYEISQPNELINDWDVCDWKFDYRNPRWRDNHTPEELKRFCCK